MQWRRPVLYSLLVRIILSTIVASVIEVLPLLLSVGDLALLLIRLRIALSVVAHAVLLGGLPGIILGAIIALTSQTEYAARRISRIVYFLYLCSIIGGMILLGRAEGTIVATVLSLIVALLGLTIAYLGHPHRPHCTRCGYSHSGLTFVSRCPECGLQSDSKYEWPGSRLGINQILLSHAWKRVTILVMTIGAVIIIKVRDPRESKKSFESVREGMTTLEVWSKVGLPDATSNNWWSFGEKKLEWTYYIGWSFIPLGHYSIVFDSGRVVSVDKDRW